MKRRQLVPAGSPRSGFSTWEWRRNYRVWDANRKVFIYPENWIEPDLRNGRVKRSIGVRIRLTTRSRAGALVAAHMLASALQRDLYRVDLGSVVSKYVGQTERQLSRVFAAAERAGAILLLDEADALFDKRSDVKASHDRYTNIETNYLLQRLAAFSGVAILATARGRSLDEAFPGRFDFVIRVRPRGKTRRRKSLAH